MTSVRTGLEVWLRPQLWGEKFVHLTFSSLARQNHKHELLREKKHPLAQQQQKDGEYFTASALIQFYYSCLRSLGSQQCHQRPIGGWSVGSVCAAANGSFGRSHYHCRSLWQRQHSSLLSRGRLEVTVALSLTACKTPTIPHRHWYYLLCWTGSITW